MSDSHNAAVAVIERQPEAMSPVVRAGMEILAQNPSPETLRELLAVQKEWEANEARKRFAQALVDLKRDLPTVLRHDKTVHFESSKGTTHYTHVSLAAANEAITEPLSRHGFALTFTPSTTDRGVSVRCQLRHAAGHFEESSLTAPLDTSGNKNPVQQVASTVTYLKRYLTLSMLGIATADMPDADEAPAAAPDPERIDTARNMRAIDALKKYGKTRGDAEEYLGKTIAGWTTADLEQLKAWVKGA
jgi:hypothetical protein